MRFMVLVKANKDSEVGVLPDQKILTEMGKFNEELAKAGVMLAGEGLQASSKGARVRLDGKKRTVIDGPFTEAKELSAGFWMWQVKPEEQAIEWVKRAPGLHPPSIGVRVSFAGGKPKVTDGPFTEAKEVLGGYWMIQVKSKEEAIEWAKRCPASENEVIEVRQVQELSDFPPDVQKAAAGFPEMQEQSKQRQGS